MEKSVLLLGTCGKHYYGQRVSYYDYFTARDYNTVCLSPDDIRLFWVKGKNKVERAEAFINKALSDGLTVETYNQYGERLVVVGVE